MSSSLPPFSWKSAPRSSSPSSDDRLLSRRAFALGGLTLAAGALLAGCGDDTAETAGSVRDAGAGSSPAPGTGSSPSAGPGSSAAASASAGTGAPATDAFPVTIEHKFGSTEIAAEPQRVVSVGLTEQDFLLALGIVPVADTDWYGGQPNAIWPWAKDALGDAAPPQMLTDADGVQYLEVAKLKPDLIIGLNAGLDEAAYSQLAKIGPTIASPSEGTQEYFDSWPLYLDYIGRAVGRSQQAADLEQQVRDQFSAAAKAHPEFAGKKAIFVQGGVSDGNFYAYQQGLGTEFLTDLGFEIPAVLDEYVPAEGGQALVPAERIEVFDEADYLIWATESDEAEAELKKLPGFSDLAAVKAGKSVYCGEILSGAIYFSTPLSLPYIVENLVPLLAG